MRHLLVLLVLSAACAAGPARVETSTQPLPMNTEDIARADNRMGLSLLKLLAAEKPGENVFISPTSIAMALTMTWNGAAGTTSVAMADALSLSGTDVTIVNAGNAVLRQDLVGADKKVKLAIANSLWANKGVKLQRSFVEACQTSYGARVTTLDFKHPKAVSTINDWVSRSTNGLIKGIIEQLLPEEILVLVNAIYFKGSWAEEFDKKKTEPRDFHLPTGKAEKRQMMRRDDEFRYRGDEDMQAVSLPYGDGGLSMYLFLPAEKDGITDLLGRMTVESWEDWFAGFTLTKGEVVLPRFKIEFGQSLVKELKALGMAEAFTAKADFSKMVQPPATAAISDVIHKTFVLVNEEGTEAAAVTAVKMIATAMPNRQGEPFEFVADHPFVCAIRDNRSGAILFLGVINDPVQQ